MNIIKVAVSVAIAASLILTLGACSSGPNKADQVRVSFARDGIVLPPDTTDATIDAMGSRTCTLAGPVMDAHNASGGRDGRQGNLH